MKILWSALLHRATITTGQKYNAPLLHRAAITRMWANDVMAALPNIGVALCSMPQSLGDAHYQCAVQ